MLFARQAQLSHHISAVIGSAAVTPHATSSSPLDPLGVPTPHELARRHFTANYVGNFNTGPGQTNLQSLRVQIIGAGTSSQFLHTNISMIVTNPTDPTASITGQTALYNKNSGNTGDVLILDLASDPGQAPSKPATNYTWTVNAGSGGTFSNAIGQGTLSISYGPGRGKSSPRVFSSGRAYLKFTGSVSTTGIGDNTVAFG